MISSNYDQVAVNGVNSSTIQKVVSRKCKKYIQKYAEKGIIKIKDEIMDRCTGFCIDDSDKRMFCFDFFTL